MSQLIKKSLMSQRSAEKHEQQRAFHEKVRSGRVSASDAVRAASFFPANQKPKLISRPSF